jgi:molybdenum cofactor cytidylyltransferase
MAEPFSCSLVLLAAGGSRRMGRPKQLLSVQGKPLIRHMAEAALAAPVGTVIVVLGAEVEQARAALDGLPVQIAINPEWQFGLSRSLRVGVQAALAHSPDLHALIVCLADQPNLSREHLGQMITRFQTGDSSVVASVAGESTVPPILFDRTWFAKLCAIEGDIGARALLRDYTGKIATVLLDSAVDLDTPEDYERFIG